MAGINKHRILIALVLVLGRFLVADSYAQVLPDLQKSFAAYQNANVHEKLFVHVNKNFYVAGEILWFKIYCTNGSDNKPLALSKVAYVELIDDNHNAVMQSMVSLSGGSGSGSLYLPFSLSNGNYQLRAYTNWMKNFDPAYFFKSQVTIVNPLKPFTYTAQTALTYNVQFFPEGGHLVQGVNSKVAFKVTGSDGNGANCTGAVIGRNGDTVARFSTLKFGIGSFIFKPVINQTYKAVIKVNGQVLTSNLPQALSSGYVLRVTDQPEKWDVHVSSSDSTSSDKVYLVLHNNYNIKQAEAITLHNGSADLIVAKNTPENGISYMTLFDEQQRPVCERTIFKMPSGKLLVDAQPDMHLYNTRRKVSVSVATRDEKNNAIAAGLSVSVFRSDDLQNRTPGHISSYLWLRSSLKGRIESPDYYFEDKNAGEALDNLLLAQGWTQFDWSKLSSPIAGRLKFLPEYTGPVMTGRITNTLSNQPAANITAYLTINGRPDQLYIAKSDTAGRILFNTQKFYGLHELVAQTNPLIDSIYKVEILNPFAERDADTFLEKFVLNADMKNTLAESSVNMQVQNIFASKQIKQFYPAQTDSTWFFGQPAKTYHLDDYTRFTTMEEVLREYVGSIAVIKRQGKFDIHMFNVDQPLGEPLVMLDGIPVFNVDKVFKWDPLKIKQLDMITTNYLYGQEFFNGIMSFTTYKDDGANIEIDPHSVVLDYEGLQQERQFYSPVYDTEQQINSTIPDFRTALYWNPHADTKADGKSGLIFYTSDKPGHYIGIIEGITSDGKTGNGYFSFEVKR